MNDRERQQWIDNDEGLYNDWRASRQSQREFIRQNRAAIDAAILPVIAGTKPAHHLAYDRPRKVHDLARLGASVPNPKTCVKCGRVIRRPYLADDEPERCARCADS